MSVCDCCTVPPRGGASLVSGGVSLVLAAALWQVGSAGPGGGGLVSLTLPGGATVNSGQDRVPPCKLFGPFPPALCGDIPSVLFYLSC